MDFELSKTPPSGRKGKTDNFTEELNAKLKERRQKGLSADLTESEDDAVSNVKDFSLSQTRPWQPPSFKKTDDCRSSSGDQKDLTGTKSSKNVDSQLSPVQMSGRKSPYLSNSAVEDTTKTPLDAMFGQRKQTQDEDPFDKIKNKQRWQPPVMGSGHQSDGQPSRDHGSGDPDQSRTSEGLSHSKHELIYGRKSPYSQPVTANDDQDTTKSRSSVRGENRQPKLRRQSPLDSLFGNDEVEDERMTVTTHHKPWQPPSSSTKHNKHQQGTSFDLEDRHLSSHQPKDFSEDSDESPRSAYDGPKPPPKPRSRQVHGQSQLDDQHDKIHVRHKISPAPRKKVPATTSDIFGRRSSRSTLEADAEVSHISSKDGRQTPTGSTGRKTPVNGRKMITPTKDSTNTRKTTPLGSRSNTPLDQTGKKTPFSEQQTGAGSRSSLLDMLGTGRGDSKPRTAPRRKSLLAKSPDDSGADDDEDMDDVRSQRRPKPAHRKDRRVSRLDNTDRRVSRLDNTDDDQEEDGKLTEEKYKGRGAPPDNRPRERESSLCREVEADPTKLQQQRLQREREKRKRQKESKQRESVRQLEDMIDQVADAQDDDGDGDQTQGNESGHKGKRQHGRSLQPIEPPNQVTRGGKSDATLTKPKPHYGSVTPNCESDLSQPNSSFNDTVSIRQSVYKEWYNQKIKSARKEKAEKEKRLKQVEEEKQREMQEKKLEEMAARKAWQEAKKEDDKQFITTRKLKQQKKTQQEKEKLEKKKDAELSFRKWKEDKDVFIREKSRVLHKEQMTKTKAQNEKKMEKKKESEGSFDGWKRKKDKEIKETAHEQRKENKIVRKGNLKTQMEKEKEAEEQYDKWIEDKEKQQKMENEKHRKKKKYGYENVVVEPWCPGGQTIPFGR